jgi:hypothetical protein
MKGTRFEMRPIRVRPCLVVLSALVALGVCTPALAALDGGLAPPVAGDDAASVRQGNTIFIDVVANDSDADGDPLEVTVPLVPTDTPHGTVQCFGWGECEYTADGGYLGPDGFDYTISDGETTDVGHVTITVNTNNPPVALDDELHVKSGASATVSVLLNDDDPDEGDELTVTSASPSADHGTVSCNEFECTYTSAPDYVGADGFDYTISDGMGGADTGHVVVTVAANQPPEPADDTFARGDEAILDVVANDLDPDSESLTLEITAITQPSFGIAEIVQGDAAGWDKVSYAQTSNLSAVDSFTYTVSDPEGDTATATVTLVPCPMISPALDAGGIVVGERWHACSGAAANASAGPTTSILSPLGGTSVLLTSGDASLAPGPNDDSGEGQDNRTEIRGAHDVSILRLDLDIPPAADCLSFDLVFQSEEFPEYVGSFNDGFLAELDASTWELDGNIITAPLNFAFDAEGGIVSVNSAFFEPGRVITDTGSQYDGSTPLLTVRTPITPGPHTLYLSIFDAGDGVLDSAAFVDRLQAGTAGPGGCAAGANEPPNALDDALSTAEDTPGGVNVLANDTDPDGHALAVTTLNPSAAHGTVSCTAAGACTYTPNADYHGSDSFVYGISDGHGGVDTATVSVTVTPVNDDPDPNPDVINTSEGAPGAANVLANDFDVDGDTLTISGFTQGANGTVSCVGTDCTYTPNPGYSGPDSFTYSVSDGNGGVAEATVSVTVAAGNEPPVADDETLTVPEDGSDSVDVLVGDTDPDGDTLTVTTPSPTALHGSVSCTAAGVCTYTPNANYHGPDSFTYTVSDGNGGQDTGQVSVTVTSVNDDPNAVDDSTSTMQGTPKDVNVLGNDADVDGDTLTVTTPTPSAGHGTVSCTGAGVCTYTPEAGFTGTDSFTYEISDGHGGTDIATVNVDVTAEPPNQDPSAADDELTTAEDTAKDLTVLANDTDPDGDSLTVTSASPPAAHGTVSCTSAGECTYTPAANYHGPDGFDYTVSDGKGGTDTGHVSITVTPVNDDPNAVDDSTRPTRTRRRW